MYLSCCLNNSKTLADFVIDSNADLAMFETTGATATEYPAKGDCERV